MLKIPDAEFLPALIQALVDKYSNVRKQAAIALGNLGNHEALNALKQALDDPEREVFIHA
ncbi:hypothetical protein BV372_27965 [Nostoc sp. T09]|uniref:HEAT repeat domain-containing protein n=1 Tax=Nostoc sp. T09 TaxID=1932621 RepID=UPI000A36D442|nr:HEAT repeat domain-containing protein [Nostoc sp. T09]OUL25510.1 hypothetical protein BV372_27965 [Nostoc sp. T09]